MRNYVIKRVLIFFPTLFGGSLLIFFAMRIVPGDPTAAILGDAATPERMAQLREELGLNRPLVTQYVDWIWDVVRLDFGESLLWQGVKVRDEVIRRYPATVQLTVYTMLLSLFIGLPVGILAAARRNSWLDYTVRGVTIMTLAVPTFWLGIVIIYLVVKHLEWFPSITYVALWDDPWENLRMFLLPAAVVATDQAGSLARYTRSQLLEVLREDYVRTAQAKGLLPRDVMMQHALRNALLPVVTVMGGQLTRLITGLVVIETVFQVKGVGSLLVIGAQQRDFNIAQSGFVFVTFVVLTMNLMVDILYGWIDPRIRYS